MFYCRLGDQEVNVSFFRPEVVIPESVKVEKGVLVYKTSRLIDTICEIRMGTIGTKAVDMKVVSTGKAHCQPGDKFNRQQGQKIALSHASRLFDRASRKAIANAHQESLRKSSQQKTAV